MRVLSIRQPWAYLIAVGIKDIENRTRKTNYRGKFLIHATKYHEDDFYNFVKYHLDKYKREIPGLIYTMIMQEYTRSNDYIFDFPYSAIIGETEIIDCVQDSKSIWAEFGCWHYVLKNSVLYDKPVKNIKGKLGFWEYDL